jgi:hypothetical protein
MPNDEKITHESPFDTVEVFEIKDGLGGARVIPLYRTHRDQIRDFGKRRTIPGSFVLALLRGSLIDTVRALVTYREWDGVLGAMEYARRELDPETYGSIQKVSSHLQRVKR